MGYIYLLKVFLLISLSDLWFRIGGLHSANKKCPGSSMIDHLANRLLIRWSLSLPYKVCWLIALIVTGPQCNRSKTACLVIFVQTSPAKHSGYWLSKRWWRPVKYYLSCSFYKENIMEFRNICLVVLLNTGKLIE